jgi:PAS domain S-box-containing protein
MMFIYILITFFLVTLIILLLKAFTFKAQRSDSRFKTLLEATPAATVIFNHHKISFVNTSFVHLTGYSNDELKHMNINHLLTPVGQSELEIHFSGQSNTTRSEVEILTKNNQLKWIDFSSHSVVYDNQPSLLASAIDITDKKNYEKQLIDAEERYALIVLATNDGISDYDITSEKLYLSAQWKEMLGFSEYEIENSIGQWISLVHPEDRQTVTNFLDQIKKGNLPSYNTEYKMICKDNSFKWISASFSVVFDTRNIPIRILGTHSDITQRKITERELQKSEFRYKSLFYKNSAVMLIINPDTGMIRDVNQSAIDYYGYSREAFYNLHINDITIGIDQPGFPNHIKTQGLHYARHILSDASVRDVEIYNSEIQIEQSTMLYSIIFDITERKKIENELQKAKETAEEALQTKSFFISNVSHEIRTPLNAIVGLTDLTIQDEDLSLSQLENLKSIKYASDHLLGIINDVLDFSKLEAGRVQLEKTVFDINQLVNESAQTINFKAREKAIDVNIFIEPNIPHNLLGDPSRLRQILLNLLSNSIKFTHRGQIDVNVRLIENKQSKVYLEFCVRDTGIGIPHNKLDNIFESFTQADSDTTRKFGGTGLGLSICKKLIEMQDGKIGVKSQKGVGSTFWFHLAYEVSSDTLVSETIKTRSDLKNLEGIKILLVEDDKMNQYVMKQIMKKWQNILEIVDNGMLAIEKLKSNRYHLVLMDLHMPELNGYETTKIIRDPLSEVQDHEIPVIALTADVSSETREKVRSTGMNDFITKPSSPDDIYDKIMYAIVKSALYKENHWAEKISQHK